MAEPVPQSDLRETLLAETHRALGARMVPFAGYSMPVQYPTGIIAEHKWTREHAGLFDVSHMGPSFLIGRKSGDPEKDHAAVAALIEPLVSGDIRSLKMGQMRYTLLLNDEGGIIDDLMIGRPRDPSLSGMLYIVVNADTKDNDFARIAVAVGDRATLNRSDISGLIALQGPEAAAVARDVLTPELADLGFMACGSFAYKGGRVVFSRSGYTGEDGYEFLVPPAHAVEFWNLLSADQRVKPIGLGARDSLRLEAGLPLYGHDLDPTTSPIEGNLAFAVSKRRREARDFPGAERILAEVANGPGRIRVGLLVEGAPARDGADITDAAGARIGVVTSGGFSPSLNRPIAMGYVPPAHAAPGTKLGVSVRGRTQAATVTPLPFVPHRYFRKG